jgi:hypothetical protein
VLVHGAWGHWEVLGVYFLDFIDTKRVSTLKKHCNIKRIWSLAGRPGLEPG